MSKITILTDFPTQYFCKALNSLTYQVDIFSLFEKSDVRNNDFYSKNKNIYSVNKKDNSFNKHKFFTRLLNLISFKKKSNEILCICGWDYFEYWFLIFFLKPKYLIFNLESTNIESKTNGFRGLLKKIFLSRVDFLIVPGNRQKELAIQLGYKKKVYFLNGVGFHNWYGESYQYNKVLKDNYKNIIYVGRLSYEKGLEILLQVAILLPDFNFFIVGSGPDENKIQRFINQNNITNITLHGYVNNIELQKYYVNNDILIIPSYSEVWGLVVEEAAHFKLPIISSDIVGCVDDFILKYNIGLTFENKNILDLKEKIIKMSNKTTFEFFLNNYKTIDFYKYNPFDIAFNNIINDSL
jgi:glycosyltransferase involved in cell wall biosynthesis